MKDMVMVWCIGNNEKPATREDAEAFEELLESGSNIVVACSVYQLEFERKGKYVWALGNNEIPASEDDFKHFNKKLAEAVAGKKDYVVTNYTVTILVQ